MCYVLQFGKGQCGGETKSKDFSSLLFTVKRALLLLDVCFADTVLTAVIKLHLPEFEKCTSVLQVMGCKSVDCDGFCITELGQALERTSDPFASFSISIMTSWLLGEKILNSGKKHVALHHI